MVNHYFKQKLLSISKACDLFNLSTSVYYYTPKPNEDDQVIAELTKFIENPHKYFWGFWMMYHALRNEGFVWNHKRVYRIYRKMGLNKKRKKYKRRLPDRVKEPILQPLFENITWSMDFMHDTLKCGKKVRTFNVIDDFNREALNITIDSSINSRRVIRELEQVLEWRGTPERLRVDNGPEFIAQVLQEWCSENGIKLHFIQKGSPQQNGYVERFNRTFREEVLGAYLFESMDQLRNFTYSWMWVYNNQRPHQSIQNLPPVVFALKYRKLKKFPTFQHDIKNNNFIILSIAN